MTTDELSELVRNDASTVAKKIFTGEMPEEMVKHLWNFAESTHEDRALRKNAKKALYILRSHKFDVDRLKPEISKPKNVEKKEDQITVEQVLLSLPDSLGKSQLYMALSHEFPPSLELYHFLTHPEKGIIHLQHQKTTKKAFSQLRSGDNKIVDFPVDYALYRIRTLLSYTIKSNPDFKHKILPRIFHIKNAHEPLHPVFKTISPSISMLIPPEEAKEVFENPIVAQLSLPAEDIESLKNEINQAKASLLIVYNKTPQERVNDIINRFVYSYFITSKRRAYREILLDIAYYFLKSKKEKTARIVVNYADSLVYSSTRELVQNPFIQFLMYKSFMAQ